MTADRSPQPAAGHVGRRASDYVRLDDLLGQAFDEIEQMGSETPAEAGHPFVLPASTLRDFAEVRDNLDALAHLVGAGAVETTRRLVADLHERTARNEDRLHGTARELAAAKHHLTTAISEREHARGVACRLEEEIARDRGGEWLTTYVKLLEQHVGPDAIDVLASRASRQVAEAARVVRGPAQVVGDVTIRLVDAGLPVIDDATLGERELVFRRDGEVVAVGRLDRLFRPLDTANEIARGATQADGPPDGETVDVFDAGIDEEWLWPDSVLWQRPTELRPTWLLTEAAPAEFVMVARPTCAEGASRSDIRRVDIGQEWACPACKEAPVPHPVRPPGENPSSGYIDVDVDPDVLTWPDLTTWRRRRRDGKHDYVWTLLASPRPDHSVFVAPPRGRRDMEPCRVEVGETWSYMTESPYPVPPGPVDPPRPPHHQPFA
jgi:hypothetical protein